MQQEDAKLFRRARSVVAVCASEHKEELERVIGEIAKRHEYLHRLNDDLEERLEMLVGRFRERDAVVGGNESDGERTQKVA